MDSTTTDRSTESSPLEGLVVLDLTRYIAGPYCTMLLADAGADVIKIEPLHGEDTRHLEPFLERADGGQTSAYFLRMNRTKKSVALDMLMLRSGNDAAQMLTEAAGGTEKALKLMNAKAAELQAYDTLAGSTAGLDVAGQSSSPYDLCLFMRQIVEDPPLRAIAGQLLGRLPAQPPQYPQPLNFGNQNQLMLSYPGAIAGKTGFTDAARHTFVAAAERNGRTLVVSMMYAENQPAIYWKQGEALLDWGFAAPADAHGAGKLVTPDEVSEAPPGSSAAAQEAAAGSGSDASPSGSADSGPHAAGAAEHARALTTWPLWPILGVLLAVAVWIAEPRSNKQKDADRPKHRS